MAEFSFASDEEKWKALNRKAEVGMTENGDGSIVFEFASVKKRGLIIEFTVTKEEAEKIRKGELSVKDLVAAAKNEGGDEEYQKEAGKGNFIDSRVVSRFVGENLYGSAVKVQPLTPEKKGGQEPEDKAAALSKDIERLSRDIEKVEAEVQDLTLDSIKKVDGPGPRGLEEYNARVTKKEELLTRLDSLKKELDTAGKALAALKKEEPPKAEAQAGKREKVAR